FDWFLFALALLVPLDVAVRRVQLDWSVILAWFGRGPMAKVSTQTMGALLQRKQKVKEALDAPRAEAPRPVILPPKPSAPRTEPAKPGAESPPPPPADATLPQSTTERLLARKRKRQEDEDKS